MMAAIRIVWTSLAQEDLRAIKRYIARDAPRTAQRFVQQLRGKVECLRQWPESGERLPELATVGVREILFGNYRIIYLFSENKVTILTVCHSSRLLDEGRFAP